MIKLNKAIKLGSMIIDVKFAFHENKKYYPQVFLDECLYRLWIKLKCYVIIELTFLNELMLIRLANQKSVTFTSVAVF